jgi:hypothetical protein
MTVSLVLLDGRRTADRINERVLKELHPHLAKDSKALFKKNLHFADMSAADKNLTAGILAQEKISAVINSHWHSCAPDPYERLFNRYCKMVQLLLYRALDLTDGDLSVIIAQQGGWETYEQGFFADMRKSVKLFSQRNSEYRNVEFKLKSAQQVRGLQLADFYAGSARKMLLDSLIGLEPSSSSPYHQLEHQIRWEEFIDFQ